MALSIAMVLLRHETQISTEQVVRFLKETWKGVQVADPKTEAGQILSFKLDSADVIVAGMPAPVPWSDLEGPCTTSILWPKASEDIRSHMNHLIVTVNGPQPPVEMSRLLTYAVAATMAVSPEAIGVYWGNATMVIPKDLFIDFAKEIAPNAPPLPIWVDVRCGKDPDGKSSGFTTGMRALGHKEFEARNTTDTPAELRQRLENLSMYVLENGPVIKDGDTVGGDAKERVQVKYGPSTFGYKEQVMQLVFEVKKSKWKFWEK